MSKTLRLAHIFTRLSLPLYLILVIYSIYLYTRPTHDTFINYTYNLSYSAMFLLGAVYSITQTLYFTPRSHTGRIFAFLSLAQLTYAVGLILWSYYNLISRIEVPYPSLADGFFISFTPFMAIAVIQLLMLYKSRIHFSLLIQIPFIALTTGFIILTKVNQPDISSSLPALTRFFNLTYPIGDVFLFCLSYLVFRLSQGQLRKSLIYLTLALISMGLADSIFAYQTTANLYWNGNIADLLFATAAFLLIQASASLTKTFTPA